LYLKLRYIVDHNNYNYHVTAGIDHEIQKYLNYEERKRKEILKKKEKNLSEEDRVHHKKEKEIKLKWIKGLIERRVGEIERRKNKYIERQIKQKEKAEEDG